MEIIVTDEVRDWYEELPSIEQRAVYQVVQMLENMGVRLGFPYSSDLKGTRYAFRELRATAAKAELRVVYAFDPRRNAVLIIGGDKSGYSRFYERTIRRAENIWRQYLEEQGMM